MVSRTLEELRCRECGAMLENTAGGNYSTCPKNHGKLHQRMSPDELDMVIDALQCDLESNPEE